MGDFPHLAGNSPPGTRLKATLSPAYVMLMSGVRKEPMLRTFPDERRVVLACSRIQDLATSHPNHSNERLADLAELALLATTDEHDPLVNAGSLLANVMHFCQRAGLAFEEVLVEARETWEADLENGPEAQRDVDAYPPG